MNFLKYSLLRYIMIPKRDIIVNEYKYIQFLSLFFPRPKTLRKNLNSLKKKYIRKATNTKVILNRLA